MVRSSARVPGWWLAGYEGRCLGGWLVTALGRLTDGDYGCSVGWLVARSAIPTACTTSTYDE